MGPVVLGNGNAAVTTTVEKDSTIFLSWAGIIGQPGTLYSSEIQEGVSFAIHSTPLTEARRSTSGLSTEHAAARRDKGFALDGIRRTMRGHLHRLTGRA